ncbi:MAG: TetR/AcrR family transcriptional regulator [Acidimicrobiales bacterium]
MTTSEVAGSRGDNPGDLAGALRAAAVDVILDKGLGAFSLREVARRAGVSHQAPGYHFGDMRGLLTSVAIEGFDTLHRETAAATIGLDDPRERLKAIGRAYVRLGVRYPAHCEVMFRGDVIDSDDARVQEAGHRAYGVLKSTVADVAAAHNTALDVSNAARLCWSIVQGLVQLQPTFAQLDVTLDVATVDIEDRADRFIELVLSGLLARP